MKQGTAQHTNAARKQEPTVHKGNIRHVAQMGQPIGSSHREMFEGKGVKAPPCKTTIHPKGSQR